LFRLKGIEIKYKDVYICSKYFYQVLFNNKTLMFVANDNIISFEEYILVTKKAIDLNFKLDILCNNILYFEKEKYVTNFINFFSKYRYMRLLCL